MLIELMEVWIIDTCSYIWQKAFNLIWLLILDIVNPLGINQRSVRYRS